jgi:very-short-patch-repair endonuclease
MNVTDKINDMVKAISKELVEDVSNSSTEMVESPIERLMKTAFLMREYKRNITSILSVSVIINEDMNTMEDAVNHAVNSPFVIVVMSQAKVGTYRAEFLAAFNPGCSGSRNALKLLAIECDGHEFHQKTKQQAARDRARDRYFLKRGIPVMRFTGSEIWENAINCVDDVISYFEYCEGESFWAFLNKIEIV